jgi:hypothetical protein
VTTFLVLYLVGVFFSSRFFYKITGSFAGSVFLSVLWPVTMLFVIAALVFDGYYFNFHKD